MHACCDVVVPWATNFGRIWTQKLSGMDVLYLLSNRWTRPSAYSRYSTSRSLWSVEGLVKHE